MALNRAAAQQILWNVGMDKGSGSASVRQECCILFLSPSAFYTLMV